MALNQLEIDGKLYDLVPVKKKRISSEKDLIAQAKHGEYLKRLVERNKILFYEKGFNQRMTWQECMVIASKEIKEEDSL